MHIKDYIDVGAVADVKKKIHRKLKLCTGRFPHTLSDIGYGYLGFVYANVDVNVDVKKKMKFCTRFFFHPLSDFGEEDLRYVDADVKNTEYY